MNPTTAAEEVEALLNGAGLKTYWPRDLIRDTTGALAPPASAPDRFVLIYPLTMTPVQQWARREYSFQRIQLGACGKSAHLAGEVVELITASLPADRYAITQVSDLQESAKIRQYPVLISLITS